MEELERFKTAIRKGGSVLYKGQFITRIKDLPKPEELASATGKVAIAAREEVKSIKAAAREEVKSIKAKTKKPVVVEEEEEEDEE